VKNSINRALDRALDKDPEQLAFLLVEAPIHSTHVIDVEKKQKLENLARAITKKLSVVELLGYHVEITVNSHKVFTLKIARKDRDLDNVIYMKIWDPRYRIKAIMLGGWLITANKWYWAQYIVIDLSYSKALDEKAIFEFVKKLVNLVI